MRLPKDESAGLVTWHNSAYLDAAHPRVACGPAFWNHRSSASLLLLEFAVAVDDTL